MAKPVLTSKTNTVAALLQYAENVLASITANATLFPDPTPSVADLTAGIEAFRESLTEAAFKDMRRVEAKNQQATELKRMLYNLSLYVETVAQGDRSVILDAGFVSTKTKALTPQLSPKPTDFRVTIPQIGLKMVSMRVRPWKSARFYRFEYRKVGDTEAEWVRVLSGKSKTLVRNLEHLKEYEFRVTYLGTDPTPNYSDIVRFHIV